VAHLRGWSLRYEKEHRKLDVEERASSTFLKELQGEISKTAPSHTTEPAQVVPPLPAAEPTDGRGAAVSAMLPLMIALWSGVGCSTGTAPAAATVVAAPPAPATALHIMIDRCGFCGQTLGGVALVQAYRDYFSEAYRRLRDEIVILQKALQERMGERAVVGLQGGISENGELGRF